MPENKDRAPGEVGPEQSPAEQSPNPPTNEDPNQSTEKPEDESAGG